MKVYELIQELSQYSADTEVSFTVKLNMTLTLKQNLTEKMKTTRRK